MSVQSQTAEFAGFPTCDLDLFAPEILRDSLSAYKHIRDLGPAVWSPQLKMFLVGRFADVKACLGASNSLISSRGVGVNNMFHADGASGAPTGVLTMDGDEHDFYKKFLMKPLMPKALEGLKERIEAEATAIIQNAVGQGEIEAMSQIATQLPVRIVADLVGLNQVGADRLLRWSAASFDAFGPHDNPRTAQAMPILGEFLNFVGSIDRETVKPGGWAAGLFDAVERGELPFETARLMVFDYATPSLDTTIMATGELLWRLATVPGLLETLRDNPDQITSAVYEAVRLATPIRGFTRYVETDFEVSGSVLPQGSRVFLLNSSANRDERHYSDPDQFDLTRGARDNLAWGFGRHLCAGMHLARLEMASILAAIVKQVGSIEAGEASRLAVNGLQGFEKLPLTLNRLH